MLAFVLNSDSGGKKTRAERLYFSSQCIYVSDAVYLERDGGEDVQTVLCVFCCGFFFVEAGGSVGKSIPVKIFVRL